MPALSHYLPPVGSDGAGDAVLEAMVAWAQANNRPLYDHQEAAILELLSGSNVILATPTGSGKSTVALAAHAKSLVEGTRSWYTAPVKALVSEKFFELCEQLGPDNVGLMTGDSSCNADAPVICCTTEILAFLALRHGPNTAADTVVLDEFHFYGEPDRGWAWQVPLIELSNATFLLMSATLGDTSDLRIDLSRRTGKPTAVIADAERPVPLRFEYRRERLHHVVEELVASGAAPLYLVNFTQAEAVEQANSLASVVKLDALSKAAVASELASITMPAGFGRDLARLLRNGIGVHHAGMLPRHRRLVERLTQQGALKVVSGTDTLGVGVNLPIRTVVFTRLYKFDGSDSRLLNAREFHQIAGRAGRAGFDVDGLVVAMEPEHETEYQLKVAKGSAGGAKKSKAVKPAAPYGFVRYNNETFDRLQITPPERLQSRFAVTPAMMLHVLDRPGDTWATMRHLLLDNHEPRSRQRRHVRRAIGLYRALRESGIVVELDEAMLDGRRVIVDRSLQQDFALNQPLAPYLIDLLADIERMAADGSEEVDTMMILAAVESILDDPRQVLFAQRDRAKTEAMAAMKAAGIEYEERIARLEKVTWPKPYAEELYAHFDSWRTRHAWIDGANISPKGVIRDMWERAMDFNSYIRHYGLKRSEGTLLRYLSEAYKALARTVPESMHDDEISELIAWLEGVVRTTDSSLLSEWQAMQEGSMPLSPTAVGTAQSAPPPSSLRALVRSRTFRWLQLAATGGWEELLEDLAEAGDHRGRMSLEGLFAPYFAEHPTIAIDADARGPQFFQLIQDGARWTVRQTLVDPVGFNEWQLHAVFDIDSTAEVGTLQGRLVSVQQM